jgi:hypothetical protein
MTIKSIKPIAAAISLLVLSSASFAAAPLAEVYPDFTTVTTTTTPVAVKTRAEVVAETAKAGTTQPQLAEAGYDYAGTTSRSAQQIGIGKTRAEVVAELRQAQADGTYVATGEAEVIPTTLLASTPRSRAEVRAEAIQSAQAAGNVRGK